MLKYEEQFTKSNDGQALYKNPLNRPLISLDVEKAINRIVLMKFRFNTTDSSVSNYRKIFKTYYNSPKDYDEDVINSVHYMRENKCVFYENPLLGVDQKIPNCELTELDGINKTTLYDVIIKENGDSTVIAAYSLS
jgi:hypothetical protein